MAAAAGRSLGGLSGGGGRAQDVVGPWVDASRLVAGGRGATRAVAVTSAARKGSVISVVDVVFIHGRGASRLRLGDGDRLGCTAR